MLHVSAKVASDFTFYLLIRRKFYEVKMKIICAHTNGAITWSTTYVQRCFSCPVTQKRMPFVTPAVPTGTMASAPPLMRSDSARGEFSPLKHFVVAKKRISDVFDQLLTYVKETSEFVAGEQNLVVNSSMRFPLAKVNNCNRVFK